MASDNNYPKLHNAAWPGVVGKGTPDSEPFIPLDTLLHLTANASVNGQKFDGIDLWLAAPHIEIDSSKDDIKRVSDHIAGYGLKVGSLVAPIWGGAGGGSAMGSKEDRERFLSQVKKAAAIGKQMREIGIRPTGGIRIDSSTSVDQWDKDPEGGTKLIAETFREAGKIAADHGEFVVAEGEICWGGMHSWRENVKLLEMVDMPGTVGYQADMAHSMLFVLGANAEKARILPKAFEWSNRRPSTTPTTRWPTRSVHGRSTSTWRRTTAPPSAPAITRRRDGTSRSTTRTAASTSPSMPATGSATTREISPKRCATSRGTAACSPMP